MTNDEYEKGLFLPYINGRYINPYEKKDKDPTIRKTKNKERDKEHVH